MKSNARATVCWDEKECRYIYPALKITFPTLIWIACPPVLPASSGKRAAIIGSGPAGITIAVLLAQKGHDVTIFESRERIGGVLRYGIPAFRLPKTILDRYKTQLLKMGIHIRPNTSIGGALTVDDLQRDGYQAIFIGTGVWRPKKLGIPGKAWVTSTLPLIISLIPMYMIWANIWQ